MTQHARAVAIATALSVFGLVGRSATQSPPDEPALAVASPAEVLAAARRARHAGKQAECLAHAERLRALTADEPSGSLLIAAARASLGPSFAKDVALHAFARTLSLLRDDLSAAATQRVLELAADFGVRGRARSLATLRDAVRGWQADLTAGKTLLLTPDQEALAFASERAGRRVEQVTARAAAERSRLARARKRQQAAEKELARAHARARAREPGSPFIDLQPIVDRITSSARTIAQADRALRAHDTELRTLRAEAKRLSTRLSEFR